MLTSICYHQRETLASYLTSVRTPPVLASWTGIRGIDSYHTIHLGHEIDILDIMRLRLVKKSSFCNFVTFQLTKDTANTYIFLRERGKSCPFF